MQYAFTKFGSTKLDVDYESDHVLQTNETNMSWTICG